MCLIRFVLPFQLVNRQKRSKKKAPVPLTADMLNELNKNHMGGIENYGQEELYNIDDAWEERKANIKPKVRNEINSKLQQQCFFCLFKCFF